MMIYILNMANNLKVSLDKFMDCSDIKTPINNLWSDFKTTCLDNLRKHVGVDRLSGKVHNLFASCIKHCIYDGIVNWLSIPVSFY
jgi:hypothetical protein